MKLPRLALVLALCAFAPTARAHTTELQVGDGALVVTHPPTWKAKVGGPKEGPTLRLGPAGEADFQVLITALLGPKALPDDAALERRVREAGEQLLPTAQQKALELIPVKGAEVRGLLYHLTDASPEQGPGDYRELRQGALVVPPLLLSVTILTHPGDDAVVNDALAALASARYVPAGEK